MRKNKINTRLIVILGYCILLSLAIFGFVTIYLEMSKTLNISEHSVYKKELVELNNTLVAMYNLEGTIGLVSIVSDEKRIQDYDQLMTDVFSQISTMKSISKDKEIRAALDSLSFLMTQKRENTGILFDLLREMEKNTVKEITKSTISTWHDLDSLNSLLVNRIQIIEDTITVISEKKGFFRRVFGAMKSTQSDTLTQVKKSTISELNELILPSISDTIVNTIQEKNQIALRQNTSFIKQLIIRQDYISLINEQTGIQIRQIMRKIENLEYESNLNALKDKAELQKKFANNVALIGFAALFVAVFFMTWILKSLSESQILHKSIRTSKKHVEKLLVAREQLIYSITHDIKAPISSIMGFLDLMSDEKLSKKQQYYINNMNSSAFHIIDLVKNLLDFQHLERNEPQLNISAFSSLALLNDIYISFLPQAEKKKISFKLETNIEKDAKYQSDAYRIRKILNNLISNAMKFTQENGEVTLSASIDANNELWISVKDNGPGIAEKDKTRIFEEFIRLDDVKMDVEGAGLGLTISKKLTHLLGGHLTLESQIGQGADFRLSLPLTPVEDELPTDQNTMKNDIQTSLLRNIRVLFIDDDRMHLNLLSEVMKKENLSFVCCSNANKALKLLEQESFNILFVDIQMPEMTGYELIEKLREMSFPGATTLPVIGFSANTYWIENNLNNGFSGFLPKPFKVHDLLKTIEKHTGCEINSPTTYLNQSGFDFDNLLEFMPDDKESMHNIIHSFIEETEINSSLLHKAFEDKDWKTVKQLAHKMSSLMRMISATEIVSLLNDFEKGSQSQEKIVSLFRLFDEKIKEARAFRSLLTEKATTDS
jgi:signal transduction histidine kinase/CheY-like chemotaxis protein/HPt (histidine-containing phosphotransfer) domain-containing protein